MIAPFNIERLQVEDNFNTLRDLFASQHDKSIEEILAFLDQQLEDLGT